MLKKVNKPKQKTAPGAEKSSIRNFNIQPKIMTEQQRKNNTKKKKTSPNNKKGLLNLRIYSTWKSYARSPANLIRFPEWISVLRDKENPHLWFIVFTAYCLSSWWALPHYGDFHAESWEKRKKRRKGKMRVIRAALATTAQRARSATSERLVTTAVYFGDRKRGITKEWERKWEKGKREQRRKSD